jgi:ribosomal subunit interface protein
MADIPLSITFRHMHATPEVEEAIQAKVAKFDRFAEHITSCRVVVEAPHRAQKKGNLYHVVVDLSVRGAELVANRSPNDNPAHEDLQVAISDAFKAAGRQLEEHTRKRRHDVKSHAEPPAGLVVKLFAGEGYGFIRTPEGREIYFHENSVRDVEFDTLDVGVPVRFTESEGAEGPQATAVWPAGRLD